MGAATSVAGATVALGSASCDEVVNALWAAHLPPSVLGVVREQGLDGATLRHARDEADLEEVGVALKIHRLLVLELLRQWRRSGVPLAAPAPPPAPAAVDSPARAAAADSPVEIKLAHGPTYQVTTPVREV